jgi:N-acetylneuraminic acid mutarotase
VSGLSGSGLVLQDDSGNNLPISSSQTSFTFTAPITSGGTYQVTVLTQPSSPAQNCAVTGGGPAPASANVTNVQVACTTTPTFTIGGTISNLPSAGLVLQNNGGNNLTISASQTSFTFTAPIATGGSYNVTVLTQPSGPVPCVLTSGTGIATANVTSVQITCGAASAPNEWTWMGGATIANQLSIYGTLGTPAPANVPGARTSPLSWTDSSGNFWLFGGYGYDSLATDGYLDDLWKYNAGQWTWMGGPNIANQWGTSGTLGIPDPGNMPGARYGSVTWTDASGDFWLFGGYGGGDRNPPGFLNDLWRYSAGEWTWMSGSSAITQFGSYGTQGVAAPGNVPGSRFYGVTWIDAAGSLWLFGGQGYDSAGNLGLLNDLWCYSAGEWTWMGGSSIGNQPGTYGRLGTPAMGNIPGARAEAISWVDPSGGFWLFGGQGFASTTTGVYLNDLWKYSGNEWTWMSGSDLGDQLAVYGTRGVAAQGNTPGARCCAVSWADPSGDLLLFGGSGPSTGCCLESSFNDLWKYNAGQWTWVSGSDRANQIGSFGTLGTVAPSNHPGAQNSGVGWTDASGNLWLFAGNGFDSTGTSGYLNDLWEYQP